MSVTKIPNSIIDLQMKRRDFFTNSSAGLLAGHLSLFGKGSDINLLGKGKQGAKNIIFMVSDGMSTGNAEYGRLASEAKGGTRKQLDEIVHRTNRSQGIYGDVFIQCAGH